MSKYVLGIDCGTQSLRTGIFSLEGEPIIFSTKEYPIYHPNPGWAEQDANDWWNAVVWTVKECIAKSKINKKDIIALSADGTSCTMLPVDEKGNPLRKSLLWMDVRAYEEAEKITATNHPVLKYVGDKESPEWMLPKALWLKKNEPGIYNKAYKIIEGTDWLTYKFTGKWTVCINNATCKWNYASVEGGWQDDLLKMVGLEDLKSKWPEKILFMGDYVGELRKDVAEELGLQEGIAVAQGGIDAYAGCIGLNVVKPGRIAMVIGTSTCLIGLSEKPIYETGVWGPYPEALVPKYWALEGGQVSTGSIVKWFKDNFAYRQQIEAKEKGVEVYSILDNDASNIPIGSEGLILLDYFQGNRCPYRDPLARGAIWGLSLKHSPAHIFRAIYEGTAFGAQLIFSSMAKQGFKPEEVYVCGGGAKSNLWLQIHSDVTGIPLYLTQVPEATTFGSAICAAVGAGEYSSLSSASEKMVKVVKKIEPDMKNHEEYKYYFNKYVETYLQLKNLMNEMSQKK